MHNLADIDREMGSLREFKAKDKIRYIGMTHSERKGHGAREGLLSCAVGCVMLPPDGTNPARPVQRRLYR